MKKASLVVCSVLALCSACASHGATVLNAPESAVEAVLADLEFRQVTSTASHDLGDADYARDIRNALPNAPEPEIQDQDVSERCFAAAKSSGQRHQGVRD